MSCFQTLLLIPDLDDPDQGNMNPFRESGVATAVPPLKILFTLAMEESVEKCTERELKGNQILIKSNVSQKKKVI